MKFNLQTLLAAGAMVLGTALVTPSAQAAEPQSKAASQQAHHAKTMTDISARRYHRHYRPQVYYRPYYRPYYYGPSYYGAGYYRPYYRPYGYYRPYYRPYGYYYGGPAYYGWGRGFGFSFGF